MKFAQNVNLPKCLTFGTILVACIGVNFLNTKASAASLVDIDPVQFNLVVNNQNFGNISLDEEISANDPDKEGISGKFSINDLQAQFDWRELLGDTGVKSLNWFQVITDTNFLFRTHNHGNDEGLLISPFIDQPNGGILYTWGDTIPWYWQEQLPPGNYPSDKYARANITQHLDPLLIELSFEDFPVGPAGAYVEFETFLIADFGNEKYDVLEGFSWKVEYKTHDEFEDSSEGNNLPGIWDSSDEQLSEQDTNGNGVWDPEEPFWDVDGEGEYEEGDEYFDNGNGQYDKGEAFVNTDGDEPFDPGDSFTDLNGNGVFDQFTDITFLQAGAQFTYEALIASEFGYTRDRRFPTIAINCADADTKLVWVPRRKRVKVGGGKAGGSGGGGAGGGGYKIVDDGYWKEVKDDKGCTNEQWYAVDDPGFYQHNPRLENKTVGAWKEFFDAPSYKWFDPVTTYGLEFQALGDTLFTDIFNFPTGLDANNLFTVVVDGTVIGEFSPGEWVDFTEDFGEGVSTFQILGIDPLDGAEATDIPFQLAFNGQTGDFRVRALSPADVPDPSSVLGIFTFGLLGWRWQRQRGK